MKWIIGYNKEIKRIMRKMIDRWENNNLDIGANKDGAKKNQGDENGIDDDYSDL